MKSDIEPISVVPLKLEIKTIVIDNKKLTKSIFNQIELRSCFDQNMNFIGKEYYGYVKDKQIRFLIWNDDGKLKRTNLNHYADLKRLTELYTYDDIEWFLRKCEIKFYSYDDERGKYKIELTDEEQKSYNESLDKLKTFINQVRNNQIFI